MEPVVSVKDLLINQGDNFSLSIQRLDLQARRIYALTGPNGAGKTTAFNVITRLYTPDAGQLELAGRSLLTTPAHRIVERGIARTFQNINLFRSMSVLENVLVGAHARGRAVGENEARAALDYVGLGSRAGQLAAAHLDLAEHPADHRTQRLLHDFVVRDQAIGCSVSHRGDKWRA